MLGKATIAALSALIIGLVSIPAFATIRCSPPTAIKVRNSNKQIQTALNTFVDVPVTKVGFNGSGDCVLVRFSADTYANYYGAEIQVLLDGTTVALPGAIPWI